MPRFFGAPFFALLSSPVYPIRFIFFDLDSFGD